MIGAQESIRDVTLSRLCPSDQYPIEETITCTIYEVGWTVLDGLKDEGLLLIPKGDIKASEFDKAKRMYYMVGIPERAQIEFFNGGHEINGQGAFRFLHKYLDWPEPKNPTKDQEIYD